MAKREIDWTAIEKDYRAGIKSNVQISKEQGVSEKLIRNKAKQFSWTKDLSGAIRAMAAEKVRALAVREKSEQNSISEEVSDDAAIIEENANIQATVIRSHRKDLSKAREVAQLIFQELEVAVLNADQLEHFAELRATFTKAKGEDGPQEEVSQKLLDFYTKIMELPQKASALDKLANTMTKLITLERTVFGITDDSDKPKETLESFLAQLPD